MNRTRFRFRDWFQVLNWESRISSPIPILRTISITKKAPFLHFLRVKTAKIVWIRSGARISIPVPIPVPHPSKSDSDTGSGSRIIKSLIPSPIPVLKSLKIRVRFRDRDESLTESLGVSVPRRENRESLVQRARFLKRLTLFTLFTIDSLLAYSCAFRICICKVKLNVKRVKVKASGIASDPIQEI